MSKAKPAAPAAPVAPAHSNPPFIAPMGTLAELVPNIKTLEQELAEAQRIVQEKMRALELQKAADAEHLKAKVNSMPALVGCATIEELITFLQGFGKAPNAARARGKMTPDKQKQLETLARSGKTGKQIAEALGISTATVASYKRSMNLLRTSTPSAVAV